ncbi:MAG TPA: class I SAM-dependent methyltransferase [Longimicrobium sp.]|nr:class I SAM-dependent methyltransferase [Longimicrobium sp.]
MATQTLPVEAVEVADDAIRADWDAVRDSGIGGMIQNHFLCMALFGVQESGLGARLRAADRVSVDDLLQGMDAHFGAGLLHYLEIRGILVRENGTVSLTPRGRLLLGDVQQALLGYYHEAYAPVIRQIAPLLTKQIEYGTDISRDMEALGRHCDVMTASFGTNIVLKAMEEMGASCILDLGCGSGGFLIDACKRDPELRGIGLDISPEIIERGRQRVREEGLEDRIEFVVADAFHPDVWPEVCERADVILAIGTIHEHFRNGEQAVIDLLDRYAEILSGRMKGFLLAEPELYRDEKDADFYLVHTFTRQGYPRPRDGWLELLKRTRLRCERLYYARETGFRFCYYHLVPRDAAPAEGV